LLEANDNWNIGFSYKSPIWQERWAFNSEFLDGTARRIGVQAQLPAIYSWGLAYKGIERTLVDVDLRYIDYANATLFGQSVPDGGLGWNSVFAVAVGGKHDLTDRLTLLGGYLYNTQPIPNTATLFNVQLPGIVTNTMSLGSSLKLTDNITMTLAWVHGFREDIQGGVVQLPRSTVKIDAQLDSIVTGINVQFGGNQRVEEPPQLAGLD
jgi:long-chain fatty acid transport protein